MKFKKLGFETVEGLSLANYEDGWSMEYGSGGSYTVDVLYNGKHFATVMEAGNGGCAMVEYTDRKNHQAGDDAVLAFLKRTNEHYGLNSEYDFCKNATSASDTEYSSLIEDLLTELQVIKFAKKQFKAGHVLVMVLANGYQNSFISSQIDDEQLLIDYAKSKGYLNKFKVKGFRREATLAII